MLFLISVGRHELTDMTWITLKHIFIHTNYFRNIQLFEFTFTISKHIKVYSDEQSNSSNKVIKKPMRPEEYYTSFQIHVCFKCSCITFQCYFLFIFFHSFCHGCHIRAVFSLMGWFESTPCVKVKELPVKVCRSSVLFFDSHWHRWWYQATAAACDHGNIAWQSWTRWGWCGCGCWLRLLHLLFIDFPLFSTPVLEPDLHLPTTCHEKYWKKVVPGKSCVLCFITHQWSQSASTRLKIKVSNGRGLQRCIEETFVFLKRSFQFLKEPFFIFVE